MLNALLTQLLKELSLLYKTKEGLLFSAILAGTFITGLYLMRPDRLEITTNAGTISLKRGNTQNAILLLSPSGGDENDPWVGTGIMVKKGDKVKITATGRVHTTLRRLVDTVENTPDFAVPWTGPNGFQPLQDYPYQAIRDKYKLMPGQKGAYYGYGMLLAAVRDARRQTESQEPIGENREFKAATDGELVLTVNDIWLKPEMKDVYVPPFNDNFEYYKEQAEFRAAGNGEDVRTWSEATKHERANQEYEKRLKRWKVIVAEKAWNNWYTDNIGSFSVAVTIN